MVLFAIFFVQLWGLLGYPPILHNGTEMIGDFFAANGKDG
jgi:hypothetical protein